MDVLSAPDGLTINNGRATYTLPNLQVNEQLVTQSAAQSLSNKTLDKLSNVRLKARGVWDATINGASAQFIFANAIPNHAIITKSWLDIITQPVANGGTAQIAISAASYGDIKSKSGIDVLTPGLQVVVDHSLITNALKLTSPTAVSIDTGGQTFTAGKFVLFVEYLISE